MKKQEYQPQFADVMEELNLDQPQNIKFKQDKKTVSNSSVLFYFIQIIISLFPFLILDLPFGGCCILILLEMIMFPISIVFWTWGLIFAIQGPQDAWTIIYYILFCIVWLPFYISMLKSAKKTIIMSKLVRLMTDSKSIYKMGFGKWLEHTRKIEQKKEKYFLKLYNQMISMKGYYEILTKHNVTYEDLNIISSLIQARGYEYHGRDFLPIALISFGDPLDFLLSNRQALLTDEAKTIIDEAITLL